MTATFGPSAATGNKARNSKALLERAKDGIEKLRLGGKNECVNASIYHMDRHIYHYLQNNISILKLILITSTRLESVYS
jgi:hypothetical protein